MVREWRDCKEVQVPPWLLQNESKLQSRKYLDDAAKMGLVLECAKQNSASGYGAPLTAAVFLADGSLLSVGVDGPGIGGHEMTNALIIASNVLGSEVLRNSRDWEFFSLAPPCLICQGNIFSERPARFVSAITHEQLLSVVSLPNTPFPNFDWVAHLASRSIQVDVAIAPHDGLNVLKGKPS